MAEKSRTVYSTRNTTVALAARVIAILAGYLTRVVFTHTLSKDYVGINSLFTDILHVPDEALSNILSDCGLDRTGGRPACDSFSGGVNSLYHGRKSGDFHKGR